MKVVVLTSPNQWFVEYAKKLSEKINNCSLFYDHKDLVCSYDVLFILGYHKIIQEEYLKNNKHNIVIHESDLPKGKGWAPLFWQILEGKNEIVFSMLEASSGVDNGDIYMQNELVLDGDELNPKLREKQAKHTINMCLEFINNYDKYKTPTKQNGNETFYKKRTPKDSELDINKTIKEQFNLLRIVNNEDYPAFFELEGNRYILKIELDNIGGVALVNFVNLSLVEKKTILSWRNDNTVKRWMYDSNNITIENHLNFIQTLELETKKQYFIIRKDNNYIGVVYFTNIDFDSKECEFGLYANPFEKIIGVGSILGEICIKYTFKFLKLTKLKLEVFEDNEKAIKLYKKYKFQEVDKKMINDKKVICMELNKKKMRYNSANKRSIKCIQFN